MVLPSTHETLTQSWLVGSLLAHRLRRWPNSEPTLDERLMKFRHTEHSTTNRFVGFGGMLFGSNILEPYINIRSR